MATLPVLPVSGQPYSATNFVGLANWVTSPIMAILRQTVAQTFANNSSTQVTMDTEDRDTDGGHSTSSNTSRYTAQTPGWFDVDGAGSFASNATGIRSGRWFISSTAVSTCGSNQLSVSTGQTSRLAMPGACRFLNISDYYELNMFQTSGGNLATVVGTGEQSYMDIRYRSLT